MTMLPTITDVTTLSDEVKSGQVYGVVQLSWRLNGWLVTVQHRSV